MRHRFRTSRLVFGVALIALTACGESSSRGESPAPAVDSAEPTAVAAASAGATSATTVAVTTAAPAPASTPAPATAAPETAATTVPVPPVLQISAPLVGGGELDFATLAGKPVALWFWAPG